MVEQPSSISRSCDGRGRCRVDLPLPRIAEAHRDVTAYRNSCLRGRCDDRRRPCRSHHRAWAQILLRKRLGGGHEDREFIGTDRHRPLEAALVRDKHGIPDTRSTLQPSHEIVGIRQLRNPTGRHEAGRLDNDESSIAEPLDQL
jgi:hypothetical protein